MATIILGLTWLAADFFPAYSSIKTYREDKNETELKFWQKYWAVRSIFMLVDFLVWPYLYEYEILYLLKLGLYVWLSYFGAAAFIFDTIFTPVFYEVEPYADILVEHRILTRVFMNWKESLYRFFIEDLEEFLVPN